MAVKSDDAWIKRAEWMVWGAVHTADWVYMVSVVKWSEKTHPVYEIISRDEYETKWFDPDNHKPRAVTEETFKNWQTTDKQKYDEMDRYLKKMDEEYKSLLEMGKRNNDELNDEERTQYERMKKFFDQKTLEWLKALAPDKFTSESNNWWAS